jgi:hypothetical protein
LEFGEAERGVTVAAVWDALRRFFAQPEMIGSSHSSGLLPTTGMKMKMMKVIGTLVFAVVFTVGFGAVQSSYAQEDTTTATDAAKQLEQAAQDGKEAVAAPTDEGAKAESNETFDTPHDADGN